MTETRKNRFRALRRKMDPQSRRTRYDCCKRVYVERNDDRKEPRTRMGSIAMRQENGREKIGCRIASFRM